MLRTKKDTVSEYVLYFTSLILTVIGLWVFIAKSPSKLGLISGDEQHWLNDFSENAFAEYILSIDKQNPYLSLLPRGISWIGFQLAPNGFQGSEAMLGVRLLTFSLIAICITFPMLPIVRETFSLKLNFSVLLWLLMLSLASSENMYIFNFSYYAIVPILLLFSLINRDNLSASLHVKVRYVLNATIYFLGTLLIINKALLAVIALGGGISMLYLNVKSTRIFISVTTVRLLSILVASSLLVFLSKSEDAEVGYSFSTLLWAVSGLFFAIGSLLLPVFAVYLDSIARDYNHDYLVGATKLVVFLFGLFVVTLAIVFYNKFDSKISNIERIKTEVLVTIVIFCISIVSLSYSQYSAWYLSNWFFAPGELLFIRHFVVPQTCLVYLMILFFSVYNETRDISQQYSARKVMILRCYRASLVLFASQALLVFSWKLSQ